MTNWLFFALMAPFLWGSMNVLDSVLRKHFIKDDIAITWMMSLSKLPFVFVFFWLGGFELPDTRTVLMILLAGALWTFPVFLYYRALEFEEPSRISLILQLSPLFTLLVAFIGIGETLTPHQTFAYLLILVGGVLAAFKKTKERWHLSAAFFYILFAAFMWATSDVLFKKFEVNFETFLSAFALYFLGSFVISMILFAHPKGFKRVMQHVRATPFRGYVLIAIDQVFSLLASFSFAYALTLGKASLTDSVTLTQPLFVMGFGILIAKFFPKYHQEDLSAINLIPKAIAFVIIAVGLWLL